MTKSEQKLQAQAEKLRNQLAAAQAVVDDLKAKLERIERKATGEPPRETGLEMLWKAAPPMARTRSSKFKCRQKWNRIPESERPRISEVINAMRAWSRCWDWKKDGGMFVPGLDKWIQERRWENLPEDTAGSSARSFEAPKKPDPAPAEEPATAEEIAAALAPLKSMFHSTRKP
jgi:hypothetical protein